LHFYLRDAMLQWVLAVVMCLSVCVCVCVFYTPVLYRKGYTDRADFCVEVSLDPCYTVFYGS